MTEFNKVLIGTTTIYVGVDCIRREDGAIKIGSDRTAIVIGSDGSGISIGTGYNRTSIYGGACGILVGNDNILIKNDNFKIGIGTGNCHISVQNDGVRLGTMNQIHVRDDGGVNINPSDFVQICYNGGTVYIGEGTSRSKVYIEAGDGVLKIGTWNVIDALTDLYSKLG